MLNFFSKQKKVVPKKKKKKNSLAAGFKISMASWNGTELIRLPAASYHIGGEVFQCFAGLIKQHVN